ncbi:MAG: amylo-alpha-1,6-glucosidase [Cytophagaceae bacterium]|jgi:predicted glycogen debranching enzyme|nr:amylo-alpha-1,6-glucosidase [Cytophagaceae bacterium]
METTFSNKEELFTKEWLVTNGLGGYASSTYSGAHTRKYHGLLVAAMNPPVDRQVIVSKVEEYIVREDSSLIHLTTNQYPGVTYPEGHALISSIGRNPFPRVEWEVEGYKVGKQVFMPHGSNTTIVEYYNTGDSTVVLNIHPLWVYRNHHQVQKENAYFDFYTAQEANRITVYAHHGAEPAYWMFTRGEFFEDRTWYKNAWYAEEAARGFEATEDRYQIGYIQVLLTPGESVYCTFSTDVEMMFQSPEVLKGQEEQRLHQLVPNWVENSFLKDLIRSGDQFVVHRASTQSSTIIAGYHWFTDWGRDTMISMLGLTIGLNKQAESASILRTFLSYVNEGMIPNRFPDKQDDAPEYNTIDGTLWMFVALYEYDLKFQDIDVLHQFYPVLEDILKKHIFGTRYNIHVESHGFLYGGDFQTQLTWMDARIGNYTVTPRYGCPVEINALWYNALKIYQFVAERIGAATNPMITGVVDTFEQHFETHFWNEKGYLNDVFIREGEVEDKIRPNQLYAISLPFIALKNKEKQYQVLQTVREHLFTPLGLRTLSPSDPDFRAVYEGDGWSRDTAYHQGTVWPFLISEYWLALFQIQHYSDDAKVLFWNSLEAFKEHFYQNSGIHAMSEIADGLEPMDGKGCIQQAWSVSTLLRVLDKAQMMHWW